MGIEFNPAINKNAEAPKADSTKSLAQLAGGVEVPKATQDDASLQNKDLLESDGSTAEKFSKGN